VPGEVTRQTLFPAVIARGQLALCAALIGWCGGAIRASEYAIGADVSFLQQAEEHGVIFKDNGEAKPGLRILKEHGYDWVRLRLFHSPPNLPNSLQLFLSVSIRDISG